MNRIFKRAAVAVAVASLMGWAVATSLVYAGGVAGHAAKSTAKVGETAPQFSLQDQDGKSVSLADYAGKIVVLEWTNPKCPVVQRHYKANTMTTLQKKYSKQNIVWLAINSTKDASNSEDQSWAKQQSISYPILNDSSGATGHAYGATNTPGMFIVDKDAKLVYHGAIDDDAQGDKDSKTNYVEKALDELLAGKTVSVSQTQPYGCAVHYAN